jgi:protein-S-isoprenylcysteine O-methyltransferase Ste14
MTPIRSRPAADAARPVAHGFLEQKRHRSMLLVLAASLLLLLCGSRAGLGSWSALAALPSGALLVGLGMAGRLWATLYHAGHKNAELLTLGPYSVCRNPMYTANVVGGLGVMLATVTVTAPLLFLLAVAMHYRLVTRREEARLLRRHGARFAAYRAATPAFLPAWRRLGEPLGYLVHPALFRQRIRHALWPSLAFAAVLLIDLLHLHHAVPTLVHLV